MGARSAFVLLLFFGAKSAFGQVCASAATPARESPDTRVEREAGYTGMGPAFRTVDFPLSMEAAQAAARALWTRLEPALRELAAGRYLEAHARLRDPAILDGTGFRLYQPERWNDVHTDVSEFRSERDFARIFNSPLMLDTPQAGFVAALGFVVKMPNQFVSKGAESYELFDPRLKDHLVIRELRRNQLLLYAEEYLHVLQFLKERAGGAFYLSRLLREPKNRARALEPDESLAEADVYAFLIEWLGPAGVPAWIGARYNGRRAIDRVLR
ncbi:MAG TPA: hypothetical protein VFV50_13270 [Bdellovibrionales bacterium]|nr:hypothetical protein [Bdellovibrionales bacterium]